MDKLKWLKWKATKMAWASELGAVGAELFQPGEGMALV